MEKKFLIPIILGVLLLCGIVFTVVYKNTSGSSLNNDPVVQTLAPKETEPVVQTLAPILHYICYQS